MDDNIDYKEKYLRALADYQNLERLNKNLEQQIKALNKNTQALQQRNITGGSY